MTVAPLNCMEQVLVSSGRSFRSELMVSVVRLRQEITLVLQNQHHFVPLGTPAKGLSVIDLMLRSVMMWEMEA